MATSDLWSRYINLFGDLVIESHAETQDAASVGVFCSAFVLIESRPDTTGWVLIVEQCRRFYI